MRKALFLLSFVIAVTAKCQVTDSAWLINKYLPRFYTDTGTFLPATKLVDVNDQEKALTQYKGKILYVDVWASWCGNCLIQFPYQQQLLKRLRALHIDSLIQFISINIDDTKKEWRKTMKKHHPAGINLYCSDTAMLTRWNVTSLPAYLLLDSTGKVLGKKISAPDEAGTIDYILYAATKGVPPVKALWKLNEQGKLMERYQTANAFTDKDFANWSNSIGQPLLEFQKWQKRHE